MFDYFMKMKGRSQSPPAVGLIETLWSWLGAFLGIALLALVNDHLLPGADGVLLIGSWGASCVLIFGAIKSPLAQPGNLIGGHIFSAVIGVTAYQLFPGQLWFASALAVSTAIAVMHLTKTLHPPGGATALIAVIGGDKLHKLGYVYVIIPVGLGAVVLLAVALLLNNVAKDRRYPEFWL
ncbi:MAG: HPP family protein [Deltaproteobacteria bacterium]|nr:HPP family protein [Deltaproteobacteria bacterium]